MKSTRCKSARLRWLLAGCFLTALVPQPVHGQSGPLKKLIAPPASAKPAESETPDATRDRFKQWQQDARDTLARLDAPDAAATLPVGISPEELNDRRRDLEQIILTLTRSFQNINSVADSAKALEASRAEDAAWSGFSEKPPYSLLLIDELLNERDAIQAKLTSHESALTNFESMQTSVLTAARASEENVNAMIGEVQKASPATVEAAKWRLEAARAKSRQFAARADLIQSGRESLKVRIAAEKINLALIERKVKTASANARFNDEDLAKIAKLSEAHKQALHKEQDIISKRLKTAMTARAQAQSALDALVAGAPAGKEPEGLDLAKFRLEVAEGRIETIQLLGEGLDGLTQLENLVWEAYQDRQTILKSAIGSSSRNKALAALDTLLDRIRAWESVLANEAAGSSADLSKLEARAAAISAEDPRFSLLNEQRAAKSEKLAMLQRLSQAVLSQRKLIQRWDAEYSRPKEASLIERLSGLGTTVWSTMKTIWSWKVMSFDDQVEVEGRMIPGHIPVTLGMLVRALAFFLIGYWILGRIARRIQRSLVSRSLIAEAQARTLRKWAMVVIGVFLAIATLSFLKIPLTVFAFFGGALAIGLGFGMQTLIKNFISGIIVLAERKVRVGDVLDVEGIVGTVIEINTRSSVIRSADDLETMIPNSVFLENRVTNWTLSNARMRRSLRVGVAYGTAPQKVMEILTEAAGRHGLICKEPAPFAVLEDFGDSALVFSLYFWLELKGSTNAMIVTSDLRLMIEKRFAEAGISVPFPQRDLHLATERPLQIEWAAQPTPPPDQPQP